VNLQPLLMQHVTGCSVFSAIQ